MSELSQPNISESNQISLVEQRVGGLEFYSRLITFLSAISIFLGLIPLFGAESILLARRTFDGRLVSQVSIGAGATLFMCGVSFLVSRGLRRSRIALIFASTGLFLSVLLLLESFLSKGFWAYLDFDRFVKTQPFVAIPLFLCAIASVLSNFGKRNKSISLLKVVLGLTSLATGILLVYGYLSSVELTSGWETPSIVSPIASFGIVALSLAVVTRGWSAIRFTRSSMRELSQAATVIGATGMILLAILSSLIGIITLHQSLRDQIYFRLQTDIARRTDSVEQLFRQIRAVAQQISVDVVRRELLEKYLNGTASKESYQAVGEKQLKVAAEASGIIEGITTVGVDRKTVISIGIPAPRRLFQSKALFRPSFGVTAPFWFDDNLYYVVRSPIFSSDQKGMIGSDLILISFESIRRLVNSKTTGTLPGTSYLAATSRKEARLFHITANPTQHLSRKMRADYGQIRRSASKALHNLKGMSVPPPESQSTLVSLYAPVPAAGWGLVTTVDRQQIEKKIVRQGYEVAFVVLLLSFFGTILFYAVLRAILRHGVALETRLQGATKGLTRELHAREEAEGQIKASLVEKEVLLKEIHHRVKNNLQIISSILSLQSRRSDNPFVVEVLAESQLRLQSIALLHETLYRSQNLSKIDMNHYLHELVNNFMRSLSQSVNSDISLTATDVILNIDKALPFGLITTELVSNAFKHAYKDLPPGASRPVSILLHTTDAGTELVISDKGVGMSPENDPASAKSLGLRLVRSLCQQLRADLQVDTNGGTTFHIIMPHE